MEVLPRIECLDYLDQIAKRASHLRKVFEDAADEEEKLRFTNDLCGFIGEVSLRCDLIIDSVRSGCESTITSGGHVIKKPQRVVI